MTFLALYGLFALVTAIMALVEIIYPVIEQQSTLFKVDNKEIIYVAFFFLSILAAPVVFYACISPSVNIEFREGFAKGVFSED